MSLTRTLLEAYYDTVKDLQTYLSELLEPASLGGNADYTPTDADIQGYHSLLCGSYVALRSLPEPDGTKRRVKAFPPLMHMREIIDKAQERLFLKTKNKPSNVILSGYRLACRNGEYGKRGMTRVGITNHFVNTIVTALQSREWEELLQRIGADAMLHILTETSVFVSLPNDCLCQMTGDPIVYLTRPHTRILHQEHPFSRRAPNDLTKKRKSLAVHSDERPRKRPRLLESFKSASSVATDTISVKKQLMNTIQSTPADISFVRARLFYARSRHVPLTNIVAVGLPPNHALDRLNPSYHRKSKVPPEDYQDPDPRKQAADARHLSKYIFPRQYGLPSPFTSAPHFVGHSSKLPNFWDREDEIKGKGSCKTPKRLKETLALLEKLLWRHGKCGYKPLRDKACPSKIKSDETKPFDSSVILEMMSEHSSQPRSQLPYSDANVSIDSHGRSIIPHGFSQAEKHLKYKPRFAEFACSPVEVYRYAVLVTQAVIPKAFWGCNRNFQHVLRHVKEFITGRRYETFSLHYVLQGFSTTECDWLMPTGRSALQQTHLPVTDSLKRRELLEEFLFWYFDSFLLPLLRTTFYVTESSAFRNRALYFRQDDWETLCAPLIERLTVDTFHKIPQSEAEEILRQRKLGFSFVRLLPKDTGVRPIVNLRRRKPIQRGQYSSHEQSINQILQAAFLILTYEKKAQPKLLGASVFGPNEVYSKLKGFKCRLLSSHPTGKLPKLFFVKVDVKACFDSIEQTKLLEILRNVISEDAYMIHRHGQISPSAGKIKQLYQRAAIPDDDHPHFLSYAAQLAEVLHSAIFVDHVVYPMSKKQEILALLEEHITDNIVKIGTDYFRQMVGIPQGSVLSTILCSFFYGDLEKRFFKFTEDPHSALLRLVDDYLYITTSLAKATGFLDMMYKGHPEYGCFISKEKTLTNFEYDTQIMNVTTPLQKYFPWCGYRIDMQDLSISVDYARYGDIPLEDTITVDRGRRPGASFLSRMLYIAKARIHIIYCDITLNTEHVVYLNIYQNFLLAAMKMHAYIRNWGLNVMKSSAFVHSTVQQMITYTLAIIQNKSSNYVAKAGAGRCNVQKAAVMWLGKHAFHTVLSRKPMAYRSLIKSLAFEMSLPQYRRSRKRFRGLVNEGLAGMTQIPF